MAASKEVLALGNHVRKVWEYFIPAKERTSWDKVGKGYCASYCERGRIKFYCLDSTITKKSMGKFISQMEMMEWVESVKLVRPIFSGHLNLIIWFNPAFCGKRIK